ncbi:MAG TPA: hypothetical protein VFX26_05950 [Nitrososphaeraceae archaeon]|jgi:hypothetical protein|nr:hypothetical protein [Nitrososphaeraceae archaeon]
MSTFSEDDIRRAAEVREWLVKEVTNKKEELDKLRDTLLIVDSLLKKTSFITASHLESSASNLKDRSATEYQSLDKEETVQTKPSSDSTTKSTNTEYGQDDNQGVQIKSLKRAKDNLLISNAEYTSTYVKIPLVNDINLNINTPPFKSFFLNRILEGMKSKDKEKIQKGEIDESEIIDYNVDNDENGQIKSVTISNYRERERLIEIFNTATWVFTRMLEKGI